MQVAGETLIPLLTDSIMIIDDAFVNYACT